MSDTSSGHHKADSNQKSNQLSTRKSSSSELMPQSNSSSHKMRQYDPSNDHSLLEAKHCTLEYCFTHSTTALDINKLLGQVETLENIANRSANVTKSNELCGMERSTSGGSVSDIYESYIYNEGTESEVEDNVESIAMARTVSSTTRKSYRISEFFRGTVFDGANTDFKDLLFQVEDTFQTHILLRKDHYEADDERTPSGESGGLDSQDSETGGESETT